MKKLWLIVILIAFYCKSNSQFIQKEFIIGANIAPALVVSNATPVAADFNGDGKIDLGSRGNSGVNLGKFLIDYNSGVSPVFLSQGWDLITASSIYGTSSDFVVVGKYDADTKADISVYFPATKTWKIDFANNGFGTWDASYSYSAFPDVDATAVPVQEDFDGDGKTDISFKNAAGKWMIDYNSNGFGSFDFSRTGTGGSTAHPIPADYDGDGKADLSVKTDAGEWKFDYSIGGYGVWDAIVTGCGDQTSIAVPAKYSADSRADLSIKNNLGSWKISYAASTGNPYVSAAVNWSVDIANGTYGDASAVPVAADFVGSDGRADFSIAVITDGRWLIDNYSANTPGFDWSGSEGKLADDYNKAALNSTDLSNYNKLKTCNFNLGVDAMQNYPYDYQKDYYLTLIDNVGVNVFLSDSYIYEFNDPNVTTSFNKTSFVNHFKNQIATNLKSRIYGINLGDEPGTINFTNLAGWATFFKQNYSEKPTFNNLLPRYGNFTSNADYQNYLNQYSTSDPYSPFACFDHYPFRKTYFLSSYFYNLFTLKNTFPKRSLISTIYSADDISNSTNNDHIQNPNEKQLQFMAFSPIAYGAKGLIYFPYDNFSTFISSLNTDNIKYNYAKNLNLYLKNIVGPVTIGSTNIATLHKANTFMNTSYPFTSSELLANYTGLIKDVTDSAALVGIFAKSDTTSDTTKFSVGNYYIWLMNKDTVSKTNDTVILRGNYVGNVQLAPRVTNYINNPTLTYSPVTVTYNASTNTSQFIISSLAPCEGIMLKVFTSSNEATPADYDGDKIKDISIKQYDGTWLVDYSSNGFGKWDWWGTGYGDQTWHSVPADYDGDGKADLSVKTDAGEWKIDYSANGYGSWDFLTSTYGDATAHPVPADYDGDGKADLSVKTDAGGWFINYASNGYFGWDVVLSTYGDATAHPVPADYDGDGKADLSVKTDAGGWLINYASNGYFGWDVVLSTYGDATAHPVPADYDGDGKADLSVKTDAGAWLINYSSNGFFGWDVSLSGFGNNTQIPLPGDYGGDKKADLSIKYPNGDWKIDYSGNGFGSWDFLKLNPVYNVPGQSARPSAISASNEDSPAECLADENRSYKILSIYDINGRLVKKINQTKSLKELKSQSNLKSGVYVILIEKESRIINCRVLISN